MKLEVDRLRFEMKSQQRNIEYLEEKLKLESDEKSKIN